MHSHSSSIPASISSIPRALSAIPHVLAQNIVGSPEPLGPNVASSTQVSGPALNVKVVEKIQMAEINPGIWDGLTPDQARKYYPQDWERFVKDPYSFRAPRAESYHDLSGRFQQHVVMPLLTRDL